MLHNSNVAENRKMTREQFISTNLAKDPQMKKLNLGGIYDAISSKQFATKSSYLEKIYERILAMQEQNPNADA